jgi:hypothetical protein
MFPSFQTPYGFWAFLKSVSQLHHLFLTRVRRDRRFEGRPRSLGTFWAGCGSGTAGTARLSVTFVMGRPQRNSLVSTALCSLHWSMRPHVVFVRHMHPPNMFLSCLKLDVMSPVHLRCRSMMTLLLLQLD